MFLKFLKVRRFKTQQLMATINCFYLDSDQTTRIIEERGRILYNDRITRLNIEWQMAKMAKIYGRFIVRFCSIVRSKRAQLNARDIFAIFLGTTHFLRRK